MDNKRPQRSIISTGTTSIVLIFVMLSLLTFSVLSLVSAQADLRLSRKSADRTTDYYEAENEANSILIGLLSAAQAGSEDLTAFVSASAVTLTEDGRAAYQVPLGEDQVLAVELTLPADGTPCRIDRWQAVSNYEWAPDETLNLFGPGSLPDAASMEEQP